MMQSLIENQTAPVVIFDERNREPKTEGLPAKNNIWLRFSKHPLVMPYNRLAVLVVAINSVIFALKAGSLSAVTAMTEHELLNLVIANFAVALLIRQQYVINLLFALATSAPLHWPLKVRWALGKVYHFGGIHVGAFFSGFVWYFLYGLSLYRSGSEAKEIFPLVAIHLAILTAIIVVSLPSIRAKHHNKFELIARFGGWTSLLLFWIQTVLILHRENTLNLTSSLLQSPHVWVLAILTLNAALPWFRLRKVPVKFTKASNHAVFADFDYGVTPFAGSSTDLSRNPLVEWHAFANVPIPHRTGFKLTISRAGDWTGKLIDDLPSHIWVKGIPTAGVGNIEKLFKKVVWVATGSGIGPCLPHLLANNVPSTLVWSTRNPSKTYGKEVVDEILKIQPDALIWDTDQDGKPNLAALAYEAYKNSGAEAVICIANKKVTWNVVYEMESRGIPAFGAIWDS